MENDIYEPPKSELTDEGIEHDASRWSRLGASLIDTISILIFTMPLMFFTGGMGELSEGGQPPSLMYSAVMGLVAVLIFLAINAKFLVSRGQTIGKMALKIKIVDVENGNLADKMQLLKRYGTYFLVGLVPVVGGLLSLINVLFIFGSQRRCGHDFIGRTKVVKLGRA